MISSHVRIGVGAEKPTIVCLTHWFVMFSIFSMYYCECSKYKGLCFVCGVVFFDVLRVTGFCQHMGMHMVIMKFCVSWRPSVGFGTSSKDWFSGWISDSLHAGSTADRSQGRVCHSRILQGGVVVLTPSLVFILMNCILGVHTPYVECICEVHIPYCSLSVDPSL